MHARSKLSRAAYHEYKVTRQITTGNGETYLAASERPPAGFVMRELGYGPDERPCSDCQKPCTLDYTLRNLDEINARNRAVLDKREGADLPAPPKHKKRFSMRDATRTLRRQARSGGVRVVAGQYVKAEKSRKSA